MLEDGAVGGFPALLASDEVGGDHRFHADGEKGGDRGGQAIEHDDGDAACCAQGDAGEHSELGAAEGGHALRGSLSLSP